MPKPQPANGSLDNIRAMRQFADGCFLESNMRSCLEKFLTLDSVGVQPSDILMVRAGLQYILFGDRVQLQNYPGAAILSDWKHRLAKDLHSFLVLLKAVFSGTLVWSLLDPTYSGPEMSGCRAPMYHLNQHIAPANDIMRPILREHGVKIIEPSNYMMQNGYDHRMAKQHKSSVVNAMLVSQDPDPTDVGFLDCLHFNSPGMRATTVQLFMAMGLRGRAEELRNLRP